MTPVGKQLRIALGERYQETHDEHSAEAAEPRRFRFPSTFTILFGLIILVAALTWIIAAGQYERALNASLDKEVPVAGTYQTTDPNPQGVFDVILAPIAGL